MKNIVLVCAAGMSTSLLVSKMKEAAKNSPEKITINATAGSDLAKFADEMQVLLLGPQVSYMKSKYESEFGSKGIPVEVINSVDYGMMHGEKVLERALELIDNSQ
ncbi:PTS system, cellobiose-specific IIB component [Evansella caseinilytica]|uniref:PTS system, cellobiose-specific IIB component n=1 Tax=Evansella caseinilytica TaxID=1503961 RepID=A0A1H3UV81_9BACI|nr:PTS sugar transporter subunit IIB [Evansella caseinilytica]SDZ65719.1 PTS system, cellobiose-specific IIB component [Evansella caseinilytica]